MQIDDLFDVLTFFLQLLSLVHRRPVTELQSLYPVASTHSVLVLRTQYRVSIRITQLLEAKNVRKGSSVCPNCSKIKIYEVGHGLANPEGSILYLPVTPSGKLFQL